MTDLKARNGQWRHNCQTPASGPLAEWQVSITWRSIAAIPSTCFSERTPPTLRPFEQLGSFLRTYHSLRQVLGSSIPSSAWDDPARIELEGYISSYCGLRSEPELCALDPHAVKHDGNLASDRDDSSPSALGLHQPHAPGLQAVPGN